jgi:hypothetical protein
MASTNPLRIGQVNLARSKAATLELQRVIELHQLDLVLIQEQYTVNGRTVSLGEDITILETGTCPGAGIAIRNRFLEPLLLHHMSNEYRLCMSMRVGDARVVVASVYLKHEQPAGPHIQGLQSLLSTNRHAKIIIGGDFNARSPYWFDNGARYRTPRQDAVEEFVVGSGMVLLNSEGQPSTFSSPNGESSIDLTLATNNLAGSMSNWRVHRDEISSDHRLITFEMIHGSVTLMRADLWSFRTRSANWTHFGADLGRALTDFEVRLARGDRRVGDHFNECVVRAAGSGLGRSRPAIRSGTPWWTPELTALKGAVKRALRRLGASVRSGAPPVVIGGLKSQVSGARRSYKSAIRRAKADNWRQWISEVGNADPWAINSVLRKDGGGSDRYLNNVVCGETATNSVVSTLEALLDRLIPQDDPSKDSTHHKQIRRIARVDPQLSDPSISSMTDQELELIIKSLGPRKAPGIDRLNGPIVSNTWFFARNETTGLMRSCLERGVFPDAWKEGLLKIIPKGNGKSLSDPAAYRPITLLPAFGKILEKLIRNRMDLCLSPPCERQFGFTRAHSTEDAILFASSWGGECPRKHACGIFLDISGAFDNAWWPMILTKIKNRGCPKELFSIIKSYLENRTISVIHGNTVIKRATSMGCPQGSVLGPSFWNVLFDDLLRLPLPEGCTVVAYADDALLLISGNSRRELEWKGHSAINTITNWGMRNRLTFSPHKTMGLMMKRGLDRGRNPVIRMGGESIRFHDTVKYLGVTLDRTGSFLAHAKEISRKANNLFMKVRRLSKASWGLSSKAVRQIYRGIYVAQLTYAAGVWHHRAGTGNVQRTLLSGQRPPLLAVTGAYRSVSTAALPVIAGELPADLEVLESVAVKQLKKGLEVEYFGLTLQQRRGDRTNPLIAAIRRKSIEEWQRRWDSAVTGRWTFSFFPDIRERLEFKSLVLGHYVVQLISGHGEFRGKLHEMTLVDDPSCVCGAPSQTAEHILWRCPVLDTERDVMLNGMTEVYRPTWNSDFFKNPNNFRKLSQFASAWVEKWDFLRGVMGAESGHRP